MTEPLHILSVVIPVYNEQESLGPLMDRLLPVLESVGGHEIIFINDGSRDNTQALLEEICRAHPGVVKAVHMRTNQGKSVALQTGFNHVRGELVLMMDADLQDRPEEIPGMIEYMREGDLDVVNGWKGVRLDPLSKTLPSRLFNKVLCGFTGLSIHDFNCGLKLMKRECLVGLNLYGQLHRFMLVLIANKGFKVGEMMVEHAPRRFGHSKYGTKRLFQGFFDFMTVLFITRYLRSPLYMFGFYGVCCFLISGLVGAFFLPRYLGWLLWDMPGGDLSQNPLWMLSPIMLIVGLIFICFGLLGELTYYLHAERQHDSCIAKFSGFDETPSCKDR